MKQGDQKDLINIENNTISKTEDKEILNYFEIQKDKAEKESLAKKGENSNKTKNKPSLKI